MTDETLLYRQVHPNFASNNKPNSQAFRPSTKDEKQLSVDDGDQTSPEQAYCHYTETLGLRSAGVVAVTKAECQQVRLTVRPDPLPENPAHTVIDYSGLSRGEINDAADKLKLSAVSRGWVYRPPPE